MLWGFSWLKEILPWLIWVPFQKRSHPATKLCFGSATFTSKNVLSIDTSPPPWWDSFPFPYSFPYTKKDITECFWTKRHLSFLSRKALWQARHTHTPLDGKCLNNFPPLFLLLLHMIGNQAPYIVSFVSLYHLYHLEVSKPSYFLLLWPAARVASFFLFHSYHV